MRKNPFRIINVSRLQDSSLNEASVPVMGESWLDEQQIKPEDWKPTSVWNHALQLQARALRINDYLYIGSIIGLTGAGQDSALLYTRDLLDYNRVAQLLAGLSPRIITEAALMASYVYIESSGLV